MEILVNTPGTKVKKEGDCVLLINKVQKKRIPLKKLSVLLLGEGVGLSTDALLLLIENNIDIFLVDWKSEIVGEFRQSSARVKGGDLLKQVEFSTSSSAFKLSRKWISEKLTLMEKHLKNIRGDLKKREELLMIVSLIEEQDDKNIIRSLEGRAGRIYIKELRRLSQVNENILSRNLRPARDSFNSSLNYTYGILYRYLIRRLLQNKIEPTLGFFHTNLENKNSLSFDIIERYRVFFIEKIYLLFQKGIISQNHLEIHSNSFILTDDLKKILSKEFKITLKRRFSSSKRLSLEEKIDQDIKELKEAIRGYNSL